MLQRCERDCSYCSMRTGQVSSPQQCDSCVPCGIGEWVCPTRGGLAPGAEWLRCSAGLQRPEHSAPADPSPGASARRVPAVAQVLPAAPLPTTLHWPHVPTEPLPWHWVPAWESRAQAALLPDGSARPGCYSFGAGGSEALLCT